MFSIVIFHFLPSCTKNEHEKRGLWDMRHQPPADKDPQQQTFGPSIRSILHHP